MGVRRPHRNHDAQKLRSTFCGGRTAVSRNTRLACGGFSDELERLLHRTAVQDTRGGEHAAAELRRGSCELGRIFRPGRPTPRFAACPASGARAGFVQSPGHGPPGCDSSDCAMRRSPWPHPVTAYPWVGKFVGHWTGSAQLGAPQLGAPQLGAPQLEAPQLEAPQLEAPQLEAPQRGAPSLGAPRGQQERCCGDAQSAPQRRPRTKETPHKRQPVQKTASTKDSQYKRQPVQKRLGGSADPPIQAPVTESTSSRKDDVMIALDPSHRRLHRPRHSAAHSSFPQ